MRVPRPAAITSTLNRSDMDAQRTGDRLVCAPGAGSMAPRLD
jgi:hypothetical protein